MNACPPRVSYLSGESISSVRFAIEPHSPQSIRNLQAPRHATGLAQTARTYMADMA